MGTEQNLVPFLTGCSGKKPYYKWIYVNTLDKKSRKVMLLF